MAERMSSVEVRWLCQMILSKPTSCGLGVPCLTDSVIFSSLHEHAMDSWKSLCDLALVCVAMPCRSAPYSAMGVTLGR